MLVHRREGSKAAAKALPPLQQVHVTPFLIGKVSVTWFTPPQQHSNLTVLYFHGVSYCLSVH